LLCQLKNFRKALPKFFIGYITRFRIGLILPDHCKIHAARGEKAAFTPSIAIIVDAGDKIFIFSEFFDVLFFHGK
jgi:hypothetical protein